METIQKAFISSYVMLKIKNNSDFLKIFRKLYSMDDVVTCDATRGLYDLVISIKSKSYEQLKQFVNKEIKPIKAIEKIEICYVYSETDDPEIHKLVQKYEQKRTLNPEFLSAYVLIEADSNRISEIYPVLCFTEHVVSCDVTKGKFNFILLIQSHTLSDIRRLVQEKINRIQGVSRTKLVHIINMFEM